MTGFQAALVFVVPDDQVEIWQKKSAKKINIDSLVLGNGSLTEESPLSGVKIPGLGAKSMEKLSEELGFVTLADLISHYEAKKDTFTQS
jgi:hypothetical protein